MPGFRGARRSSGIDTPEHRAMRRAALAELRREGSTSCCRCGVTLYPDSDIHLDHTDDRQSYRGWACATCNRKAGARLGGQRAAARRRASGSRIGVTSRDW